MRQIFFSLSIVFSLLSCGATAQVRTDFVFHVYVDPTFGDDDSAWELNPGNPLEASFYAEPNLDGFCRWPNDHRPSPLDRRDEVNGNNSPYLPSNGNYAMTGYLHHGP